MGSESATSPLAPGFRFHPTEEELIGYYLKRKICRKPIKFNPIPVIDFKKFEPWDFPSNLKVRSGDLEWYFYCVRDIKYANGSRMSRSTEKGYWKITGYERPVRSHTKTTIGYKKTLVYYEGRAPEGKRTDWVVHEYRLVDEQVQKAGILQDSYFLCKMYNKSGPKNKSGNQNGGSRSTAREEGEHDRVIVLAEEDADKMRVDAGEPVGMENPDQENTHSNGKASSINCSDEQPSNSENISSEGPDPECMIVPQPLVSTRKKAMHLNEPDVNLSLASSSSAMKSQGACSSKPPSISLMGKSIEVAPPETAGKAVAPPASIMYIPPVFSSLLLECPPLEPIEREMPRQPVHDGGLPKLIIPEGYKEFFFRAQNDVRQTLMERDMLRIELSNARSMVSILKSRLDVLDKENEDLKKLRNDKLVNKLYTNSAS
ncbi:NAC domain [Dillenia turbinata]|uniref:NAC domain n=1 Tax=Dillenia turbinata TaxID=194707 RepID=A0AAN8ZBK3_9MAGN